MYLSCDWGCQRFKNSNYQYLLWWYKKRISWITIICLSKRRELNKQIEWDQAICMLIDLHVSTLSDTVPTQSYFSSCFGVVLSWFCFSKNVTYWASQVITSQNELKESGKCKWSSLTLNQQEDRYWFLFGKKKFIIELIRPRSKLTAENDSRVKCRFNSVSSMFQ